ncbi:hypothetical protein EVAR_54149_1 [Eumeta japonica]|uniref:Uncharacterized protein n=1 Tax=Eumeta variegata TaxID=151549 RepID=A0A4C1XYV0_EUMVA|nr:hypothetical protein EVAR_54149_1 [Eumeta japonica]
MQFVTKASQWRKIRTRRRRRKAREANNSPVELTPADTTGRTSACRIPSRTCAPHAHGNGADRRERMEYCYKTRLGHSIATVLENGDGLHLTRSSDKSVTLYSRRRSQARPFTNRKPEPESFDANKVFLCEEWQRKSRVGRVTRRPAISGCAEQLDRERGIT